MTWAREPRRPPKQIGGDIAPRTIAPSIGLSAAMSEFRSAQVKATTQKREPLSPEEARGRRIRESARGKDCQVRYVGICTHDPAHTIWSHARWGAQLGEGGRGMGTKADDLAGAYACGACDAAFDQMMNAGDYTREALDLDWCLGHLRSLGILQREDIV